MMKNTYITFRWFLAATSILLSIISTSCQSNVTEAVLITPTPGDGMVQDFTQVPTETFSPTETPRYSATLSFPSTTPTITPTKTIWPSPTNSATPTNTFTPGNQDDFVIKMILNNNDCELPCVWGIVPSETNVDEYLAIIEPINGHLMRELPGIKKDLYYPSEGNIMGDTSGRYVFLIIEPNIKNKKITSIGYNVYLENYDFDGNPIGLNYPVYNAMKRYSLSSVLERIGMPSQILLGSLIHDQLSSGDFDFGLALLYEEQGIYIFYEGPILYASASGQLHHCFDFAKASSVRMYLHSPDDGMTFAGVLDEFYGDATGIFDLLMDQKIFIEIEEASGLSVEEFYEIYKVPTNYCIETQRDIWGE